MIDVHGKGFARLLWGVCLLALANPVQVHADNQYPPIVPIGAMEPFECDGRIFIAENIFDGVGDISGVDLGTINLTEPPLLKLDLIPSSHRGGYTYNAMGYNPIDNFIYAIKRDNNGADSHDLLRIDRNGNVEYVISLGEFTESVVADFDDEGNFYIVDYDYRLFKYRIDGNNVELVDSKPLNPPVPLQDMGYYDGALWSIQVNNQNYSIVRIDLDDFGAVTAGPFQSGTGEILSFTSVFAAKNGVYAYDTDSGNFVRIDMSSGDISQMSLQFLAKGTEMSSSDGAKCLHAPLGLPVDIEVTKTPAQDAYLPGQSVSFTIVVKNNGPWGAADIQLVDALPPNAVSASWSCTSKTSAATCAPASGTGDLNATITLPQSGASVTYQVTIETSPTDMSDIENTASVVVPEDFADQVPDNNTSTVVVKGPRLVLEKAGQWIDANDNGAPEVGEVIQYTFTVTNDTGVEVKEVTIVDPLLSSVEPASLAVLGPGEKFVFTGNYPFTEADILNENVVNVAVATAVLGSTLMQSEEASVSVHLPPPMPALYTKKSTAFLDDLVPNKLPDAGERLEIRVLVRNEGNVSMTVLQPEDAGPTFNGQKGTGTMTPFAPEQQVIPRNGEGVFVAYYYLTEEDISNSAGLTDGIMNVVVTPALTPQDVAAGRAPTAYPLLVPAIATLPGYMISKGAQIGQVTRGQQVPYVITIEPKDTSGSISVVDRIPKGFVYLPGSARVDGIAFEPKREGTALVFDLEVNAERRIDYVLVATGTAILGTHTNMAQVFQLGQLNKPVSVIARSEVELIPDPVFDCGDVIGKVFDDKNRNGYHDNGEPGIAGARVVTVQGISVTTDKHGRFSVACADLPNARVGSTYVMKLDPRSLPTGYRILSENPRTVRLTPGKATILNFATSIGRVVRLDVNDSAFRPGEYALEESWEDRLGQLIDTLAAEPSVLHIAYLEASADRGLAGKRLTELRKRITELWRDRSNRYRLEIETVMISASDVAAK